MYVANQKNLKTILKHKKIHTEFSDSNQEKSYFFYFI